MDVTVIAACQDKPADIDREGLRVTADSVARLQAGQHVTAATDIDRGIPIGVDTTVRLEHHVAGGRVTGHGQLAHADIRAGTHRDHPASTQLASGAHREAARVDLHAVAGADLRACRQRCGLQREQLQDLVNGGIPQLQAAARGDIGGCCAQVADADIPHRGADNRVPRRLHRSQVGTVVPGGAQIATGLQTHCAQLARRAQKLQVAPCGKRADRHIHVAGKTHLAPCRAIQPTAGNDAHGQRTAVLVADVVAHGELDVAPGQRAHALQVRQQAAAADVQYDVLVRPHQADTQVPVLLGQAHVFTGVGQQQAAVDLHTQRLTIVAHDAAQGAQAEVLADPQSRTGRTATAIGDIAVTADTYIATGVEAVQRQ